MNKRTINILALASFLHDMGSDMVFSIWPLFLTSVLGANMTVVGFIDGLGDALVSISQAVSGYISDRLRKRKFFVWLGYLFGGVSRIGYALSPTWQWIIPFRALDRSGKLRGAPRDAIVADVSTKKDRGRNFGLLRTMDNLGAVFGILTALVLLKSLGFRNLFFLASIPSIIAVVAIVLFIKEKQPETNIFRGIKLTDLTGNFYLFLFLSSIFSLGSFSYSFLLIFAQKSGFQATTIPLLYLLFTIVASLTALPFGRLADKIGRKRVLTIAFLFWGATSLMPLISTSLFAIVTLFVFYGIHKGAFEPVQKAFVSELAPTQFRASSLGGYQMVVGLAALPASLIAGLLWDKINIAAPFYFSLALTIVAIVLLLIVKEE